ncbi:MAG: TIGR02221 family CRISPR-associated protein [Halothece sp.]
MKIISFLGLGSYRLTQYKHPTKEEVFETKYYQEALAKFYQPEKIYIFLTPTVETKCPREEDQSNWQQLQERFAENFSQTKLCSVKNIPERNSPEDIWTIFNKVNECLDEKDEVIFDITHSFRSFPIVALLAVSYFRVVRNITITGLLYGAYEAKENGIAPTFDLLPVVRLFDWLTATDQFLKTGKGEDLAKLLQEADGHTEALGSRIREISQGLELLRPMDVMKASSELPEYIERAKPDLAAVAPPFTMLLDRIANEYGQFALAEPHNYQVNGKEALQKQLFEIEWYARKGLEVQAISLAREWLPSLLCYHFNLDPMIERPNRSEMELLLSGGKEKNSVTGEVIRQSLYLEEWKKINKKKRSPLLNLWGGNFNLAKLRNDVLHSGFRKNPKSIKAIKGDLNQVINELNNIAVAWEILDS